VVPSTSPQPVPDSDTISDINSFPSSHRSRVTHVSDTQPSRVLDTPQEDSEDMAMLDWDADYRYGCQPSSRLSTHSLALSWLGQLPGRRCYAPAGSLRYANRMEASARSQ
jgi:hypothetical protein